jgi:hypothetical protein
MRDPKSQPANAEQKAPTRIGSGDWLGDWSNSFWASCKVCCKSALGTLPKHRITAHRWLTKHNWMVGTLRAIWRLPETAWCALPQYALKLRQAYWLKLLNLHCALLKLQCQVFIRRLEVGYLRLQVRHLTVKSRKLLAQKIDMDAHNCRRAMLDYELLNQIQRSKINAHKLCGAKSPNVES